MAHRSSPPDDTKPEIPEHDEKRRELLKRGLIAAPLLVTLAARPARAQAMGSLGCYDYGLAVEAEEIDGEDDPRGGRRGRGRRLSRSR